MHQIKQLYSIFFIFTIVSGLNLHAQTTIKGRVQDADTKEPLAFATLVVNDNKNSFRTDIDGRFTINYPDKINQLSVSYVCYESQIIIPNQSEKNQLILLKKKTIQLNEVNIYPGENPAFRIIRNVLKNKDLNNPEKQKPFSYTAYNKFIVSANTDSLPIKKTETIDSSLIKINTFFQKQYLFIMESVTERKFYPPSTNNEKVIAAKVSGLNNPFATLLMTQIQSFSFYKEMITISDKNYLNPISNGSLNSYSFLLEDTLYQGNDSIFLISFKPKKHTNFDGLKGLLYINTNKWAVQSVIAEPASEQTGAAVKIQQNYSFINNRQWFPTQLNTTIYFKEAALNKLGIYGESRSYLKNIVLNDTILKRNFSRDEVEIETNASNKDALFWNSYRIDSLTIKDIRTYQIIDSIGKAAHFDRKINTFLALTNNTIPFHFIDFPIDRIINFNEYEGFRLGLGIQTNDKLCKHFNFGGYVAYGFKDKGMKYSSNFVWHINLKHEMDLKLKYSNDVAESAGFSFDEQNKITNNDYRSVLVQQMDLVEKSEAILSWRMLRYFKTFISFNDQHKTVTNNYQYATQGSNISLLMSDFYFTEEAVGFKFIYKEKFTKYNNVRISMGSKFPVLWFQYTHGFNDVFNGQYYYNKYDVKLKKVFTIKKLGTTTIVASTGFIDSAIPYSNLYNGNGSYRQIAIYSSNSFATMRMNEFLSNQYAALYFTHSFKNLLFKIKTFAPEIVIASNLVYGSLNNESQHKNSSIKTLEKGYFESGLLLNNLLNTAYYGIGVGVFYRYGAYALEKPINNFSFRYSITFPF